MIGRVHIPVRGAKADRYASREDFRKIFDEDSNGLYQLSFLLTGNPEKAQRCFVSGFEDCVTGNPVFREWAHCWAKRTLIQNAIAELKPRPTRSNSPLSATIFPNIDQLSRGPGGHFEIDAVLGLRISSGLCSSSPSWSTTRNKTVPFSLVARFSRFGKPVPVPFSRCREMVILFPSSSCDSRSPVKLQPSLRTRSNSSTPLRRRSPISNGKFSNMRTRSAFCSAKIPNPFPADARLPNRPSPRTFRPAFHRNYSSAGRTSAKRNRTWSQPTRKLGLRKPHSFPAWRSPEWADWRAIPCSDLSVSRRRPGTAPST
jgi:hypothetical protein